MPRPYQDPLWLLVWGSAGGFCTAAVGFGIAGSVTLQVVGGAGVDLRGWDRLVL